MFYLRHSLKQHCSLSPSLFTPLSNTPLSIKFRNSQALLAWPWCCTVLPKHLGWVCTHCIHKIHQKGKGEMETMIKIHNNHHQGTRILTTITKMNMNICKWCDFMGCPSIYGRKSYIVQRGRGIPHFLQWGIKASPHCSPAGTQEDLTNLLK